MGKIIGTMVVVGGYREGMLDFNVQSVDTGFGRPLGPYYWGLDENGKRYEVPLDCYVFRAINPKVRKGFNYP